MTFPASLLTLKTAFEVVMSSAQGIKAQLADSSVKLGNNPSADDVIRLLDRLRESIITINQYAATPGLGTYAQDELHNPTLDIVAEYNTMITALTAARDWIITNLGSGFLLGYNVAADGTRTPRVFTTATAAPLKTLVDNAAATIG